MMKNYNSLNGVKFDGFKKNEISAVGSSPSSYNTVGRKSWLLFLFMLLSMAIGQKTFSQTTLINPLGDGGFETGTTLAANNWLSAQSSVNAWVVGTAAGFSNGANAAYVNSTGVAGGTFSYNNGSSQANHIYRDFTYPIGEDLATLVFDLKGAPADVGYDRIRVYICPTTVTPVAGTEATTGATQVFSYDAALSVFTSQTVAFSKAQTGGTSTGRIIITWRNDGSGGATPYAVDNVKLVTSAPSTFTATANGGLWSSPATWVGGVVPGSGNDITIPSGSIVTVDQVTSYRNLNISGTVQWNATSNAMTLGGNLTINSGGKLLAYTSASTPATVTVNIAGNFQNDGYANFALSSLSFNGSGSTLSGTGIFEGDGTRGIIRSLAFANLGSNSITTTQDLTLTFGLALTAGSLNTNGKIKIDNTAQIYGRVLNSQVANLAVTATGTLYNVAPVVFGSAVTQYANALAATLGTRYVSGNNVYLCTANGTFNAIAPTSTTATTFTTSGPTLLWAGTVGSIGAPLVYNSTLSLTTQYFYGNNVYQAILTTPTTVIPVHTSGVVGGFRYLGTVAKATVNYDATTQTVRSLNLTQAGLGFSTAPAIVFSVGVAGGTGSGAAATAVLFQSIAGQTSSLIQKSGVATLTGGLTINSDQGASLASTDPQASSGVGAISTTNGGLNYTVAPKVGFAGPTALNLVTNTGSGYTAVPTITVSGGTLISGTALATANFTVTVNKGRVVSVYLNASTTATYLVPPTLAFSSGTATLAFPTNCWPTATAAIGSNGQLTNFTIINSGFGYVAAPTVGVGTVSDGANGGTFTTVATAPTARIGLYNLTLNLFGPATSAVTQIEDVSIPSNRKINTLSLNGNGNGLTLGNNLTLFGSAPLALVASGSTPGNILDLAGYNLYCSWNGYGGVLSTFGTTNTFIKNGSMTLTTRGGGTTGSTLIFPFSGSLTVFTGSGTTGGADGSNILTVKATEMSAPTNTVTGGNAYVYGNRSFKVETGSFSSVSPVSGSNPTVTLGYNSQDNLTTLQNSTFVAQGTSSNDGPWNYYSASVGTTAIALVATGSLATATVAPGPISLNATNYFAWGTSLPTITGVTPTTLCSNTGAFTITGTNLTGVSAVSIGGTPVTSFTVVSNTLITGFAGNGSNGVVTVVKNGLTGTGLQSITITPSPLAPAVASTTVSIVMGTTASFTATAIDSNSTLNWYTVANGGTAFYTGATYTTAALCASTTVYVAENNGSCEGPRTAIVITVQPFVIASTTPKFCGVGGNATLSVTPTDASLTYAWTGLTASATLPSTLNGASIDVSVVSTSDFKLVVTSGSCSATQYYSLSVYPLPSATVTTSASGVCPGTAALIGSGLSAGNFTTTNISSTINYSTPANATSSVVTLVTAGAYVVTPTGANYSLDDFYYSNIPVPFSFNYFGNNYSALNIGSNGAITFGTANPAQLYDYTFVTLPSASEPLNMVAVCAHDMSYVAANGGGTIRYWTQGYAPNRVFVVDYSGVGNFAPGGLSALTNTQAKFYETLGNVEVSVLSTGSTSNKVIGLQNADASVGVIALATATTTTNKSYRFSPPSNYFTTWQANGVNILGEVAQTNHFDLSVTPAVTTLYSINYTNTITGCSNAANSAQVNMLVLPNTPPANVSALAGAVATATTICYNDTVDLSLDYTVVSSGLTYQWQSSTDGILWTDIATATSATFTTAQIKEVTKFRCMIASCGGTAGPSAPVAVNFINNILTTVPAMRCGAGTVQLSATANDGAAFKWFDMATGGTNLSTANAATFSTSVTGSTTYYVAAFTTGCNSPRVPVAVTVTPPPTITLNGPSATICEGASTSVVSISSGASDYDVYSWTPSTGVSGSAASGWIFNPTSTTTYTLNASQSAGECATSATYTVNVNSIPLTTTVSASTVCSGTPVILTAQTLVTAAGQATIGTGTNTSTLSTGGTPYRTGNTVDYQFKNQFLMLASELSAAGLRAGNITSLVLDVAGSGGGTLSNFNIMMGNSSLSAMTTTYVTGLTQVYTKALWPETGVLTSGLQTHTFDTPFTWDGTSNIVIQVCAQLATGGTAGTLRGASTSHVSHIYNSPSLTGCTDTTSTTSSVRPNIVLNGQVVTPGAGSINWSWSASGAVNNVLTVSPTETSTYTVTATDPVTGCVKTQSKTITVNPLPVAPVATNSSQCGTHVPTASVADTNGFTTPVFKWYAAETGGTSLQSAITTTYATAISATTTFYVSVINPTTGCESLRSPITVEVIPAAVLNTTSSVSTLCLNGSVNLGVTSSNSGYVYSWSSTAGSGLIATLNGATQTITPTAVGNYVYTVVANDGNCVTSATVLLTVNAIPNLITSASKLALCNGESSVLTATTKIITQGPQTMPTGYCANGGSTTTLADEQIFGVTFGSMNNIAQNETCASNFTDYSSTIAATTVSTGQVVPFSVITDECDGTTYYSNGLSIFIDYNRDGDFDDADELAYTTTATTISPNTRSGNITIPTTATPGLTKMRVVVIENIISPTACGTFSYGEKEDYAVNIQNVVDTTVDNLLSWTPGNATTSSITVTPTVTTNYTVTATNPVTGCATTKNVTVTQNGVQVAAITGGASTVCLGSSTVVDFDSASEGITWSSSNTAVATINANGTLTALSTGSTTISCSIYNLETGCTSLVSNPQTVNVYAPIEITAQPVNVSILTNDSTSYSITTTGSVVSYQWMVSTDNVNFAPVSNTGNYDGATSATLTITNATASQTGLYFKCNVTGYAPCTTLNTSTFASLIVQELAITNPQNATVCSGNATATNFTVAVTTVSANYPYDILWEMYDGENWTLIESSTTLGGVSFGGNVNSTTLVVNGLTLANNGWKVRANALNNEDGQLAASGEAIITVNAAAVVTSSPIAQTVCFTGGSKSFSVASTGGTGVQWQYSANGTVWNNVQNGTPTGITYNGATTTTLGVTTTAATPALGTYFYKALISSPTGCTAVSSESAQLNINVPAVSVTASSSSFCSPGGSAVTLTATGASTYSWLPITDLSLATGAVVTSSPTVTRTYTVSGTDASGCINTAQVTVNSVQAVVATATAANAVVCPGSSDQLSTAITSGLGVANYQFSTTNGSYSPISGTASTAIGDDGTETGIPLGFTFMYNGNSFSNFSITTNGSIKLGNTAPGYTNNLSSNNNIIAPMWDDNNLGTGTISYAVSGVAPNRVLTVQWADVAIGGGGDASNSTNNYQVQLFEGSNVVQMNYGSLDATNGLTASIGISGTGGKFLSVTPGATTTVSSAISNNSISSVDNIASGVSYIFTPPTITYAWSPSTFIEGQTTLANPIATNVTSNITYTVVINSSTGCGATATTSISVLSGVSITTAPVTSTVCAGQNATFNVVAVGPNLTYQWMLNGANIDATANASAATANLTVTATTAASAGNYSVLITPSCGDVFTTTPVALVVNPLSVATAPANASFCAGQATSAITLNGSLSGTTFNVSGGTAIGLADQTGVTSIPVFTGIAGSATISITPVVNGCSGAVVTFTITINNMPTAVTVTPQNATVCAIGTPVLLTANGGIVPVSNYCTPAMTTVSASDDYLNNFSFANITNNNSGDAPNDYTYYSNLTANVVAGTGYTISLQGNSAWSSQFRVWFDLNHDGIFSSSESLGATSTSSIGVVTGTVTIPTTAYNGVTRMRVAQRFSSAILATESCLGGSAYGEFEDYNVNITGGVDFPASTVWSTNTGTYTGLYTDVAMTVPYTGTSRATVYARPTATSTYIATSTVAGCSSAGSTTVTSTSPFTYYVDADNDGYGSTTSAQLCSATAPTGYSVNNTDCNDADPLKNPLSPCSSVVNVKLFIEGYYTGASTMAPVKANQGIGSSTTDVDDITIELRDATTYAVVATTTGVLQTNGTAACTFAIAQTGSFYIAVKHRNAVQTWSAAPVTLGSVSSYDFTTAANKAFGDNMKQVSSGVWALYSGDLNQDDFMDLSDYTNWETDYNASNIGYYATDINGDGFVDLSDYTIWESNYNGSIFSSHP